MGLPVVYVFTHDSLFVGEDGPTHQPVEQLASLRAIPGLTVIRPADANETAAVWRSVLENGSGPVAVVLGRQKLPMLEGVDVAGACRGAYVLAEFGDAALILLASGSEVAVSLEAAKLLAAEGVGVRVVSMPSWELFEAQSASYRQAVLPPEVTKRVAVEAGVPLGWERYVGQEGEVVAMTRFGASAPYQVLAEEFGFTAEAVAARARLCLER
jgi:transketolase